VDARNKLAPTDAFSVEGGKLPTLIGAGYTFSFQNPNTEHSLLWNQEPAISRGGQLNYTAGPLALSFSLNDGFYSDRYTWLTGSATYALDNANRFTLAAGGNYSHTTKSTLATPLFQNNETILNLIFIHISAPWTFATGFQYPRPGHRIDRCVDLRVDGRWRDVRKSQLWRRHALAWRQLAGSPRIHLQRGQPRQRRTQSALRSGEQCLVDNRDADLPIQDILCPRRVFPCRCDQHDAGAGFWPGGTNTTQIRGVFEFGILF
jgi:Putative beta-barrel porin-2, OmpL-like. bbp2